MTVFSISNQNRTKDKNIHKCSPYIIQRGEFSFETITVMLADDHVLVRKGLKRFEMGKIFKSLVKPGWQ